MCECVCTRTHTHLRNKHLDYYERQDSIAWYAFHFWMLSPLPRQTLYWASVRKIYSQMGAVSFRKSTSYPASSENGNEAEDTIPKRAQQLLHMSISETCRVKLYIKEHSGRCGDFRTQRDCLITSSAAMKGWESTGSFQVLTGRSTAISVS